MEREELLEQSRKQNKNVDLYEQQVIAKGGNIGFSIGVFLAALFYAVENIVTGKPNFGVIAVWTAMEAGMFIYKYVKLKKSHELVFAIIFTLCSLAFIAFEILTLTGVFEWVR